MSLVCFLSQGITQRALSKSLGCFDLLKVVGILLHPGLDIVRDHDFVEFFAGRKACTLAMKALGYVAMSCPALQHIT